LDAEMPRYLTPCRLWQSSRGRCGFSATPAGMATSYLNCGGKAQPTTSENVTRLRAGLSLTRVRDEIYGAILEEEGPTPEAQPNFTGSYLTDGHRTVARNEPPVRRDRVRPAGQWRGRFGVVGCGRASGRALRIQPAPGELWFGRSSRSFADRGSPSGKASLTYLRSSDHPRVE
jgi:hypothetical protein